MHRVAVLTGYPENIKSDMVVYIIGEIFVIKVSISFLKDIFVIIRPA